MFDFEKLEVYRRSKFFHIEVAKWLESEKEIPKYLRDQLYRASFSVALNIAEGTARFTKPDKRNFLVIANGSPSILRQQSNSCHRGAHVRPFDALTL
jgi:four helix bundle protein